MAELSAASSCGGLSRGFWWRVPYRTIPTLASDGSGNTHKRKRILATVEQFQSFQAIICYFLLSVVVNCHFLTVQIYYKVLFLESFLKSLQMCVCVMKAYRNFAITELAFPFIAFLCWIRKFWKYLSNNLIEKISYG